MFRPCILGALVGLASATSGCSLIINPDKGAFTEPLAPDASPLDAWRDSDVGVDAGSQDSGVDSTLDAGFDAGGSCRASCMGDTLTLCEGDTPALSRCAAGCSETEPRCHRLVTSNISAATIAMHAELELELNEPGYNVDTDTCDVLGSVVLTQEDGPEVCVFVVRSFKLGAESVLHVQGGRPLIIAASEDIRIDGVIDASARGTTPGAGGGAGGVEDETYADGAGLHGGKAGIHPELSLYDDSGGGGGGLCGYGGSGGIGGDADGGDGGGSVSDWDLVPLRGGSGGGRGRGAILGSATAGLGGGGGGAIQLSALGRVFIRGRIEVAGGGGRGGRNRDRANWGSGGGGGSGGAVLIEGLSVTLEAGHVLQAIGGAGGAGSASRGGDPGDDGTDATEAGRAEGGQPRGSDDNAYGASGGGSGGLIQLNGDKGGDNDSDGANGGGGGGGAGCIRIRSALTPERSTGNLIPNVEPAYRELRAAVD